MKELKRVIWWQLVFPAGAKTDTNQIALFNSFDLYHTSPDSSVRQYESRS
jgi:hypothetical protein